MHVCMLVCVLVVAGVRPKGVRVCVREPRTRGQRFYGIRNKNSLFYIGKGEMTAQDVQARLRLDEEVKGRCFRPGASSRTAHKRRGTRGARETFVC